MTAPVVTDVARRARLAIRHHLGRSASDPGEAASSLVALHSSDPITPYLAAWARVAGFLVDQLDGALYEERVLWRLHAMRRTLFVVPTGLGPVVEAGAGRDVAATERRRVTGWLEAEVGGGTVEGLLREATDGVLRALDGGQAMTTAELSELVPDLRTEISVGSGQWVTRVPLSSRLLFLMALDGLIVRARPAGSWRSSQYAWAATPSWFGAIPEPIGREEGEVRLLALYLEAYGPATETDIRWWTGWTATRARRAIAAVGAVQVPLEGGGTGFVLPGDDEMAEAPAASVALLPGLDPTPMGWKERGWFLGSHAARLFDRNGNAGPTVWVDGRVVGGWAQRPDGEVVVEILEPVTGEQRDQVLHEAVLLTGWMDGVVATPRFRSPLEKELSAR